jgi:hypothetical protein
MPIYGVVTNPSLERLIFIDAGAKGQTIVVNPLTSR